ncbi:MAG: N-acetyltransferase [Acidimicrobiaceae bacterium]|mgnify:CR=1 FL=1|nr:N-acetyltransferase [Acidimicrobiaceae bacterium]|tara:strand:- start:571 stop:1065 length:495 start_codon:yes stop_codon:yes gene_type:complete
MISKKFFSHETAIVSNDSKIGENTKIWHFSHIREGAEIGKNVSIGQNVYIDEGVKIGDNCKIQNNVSLYKGVTVEDSVFIGPSVTFTNDLYPTVEGWSDEKIVNTLIKKSASIGANSTIICGITIGSSSLIGAGSVVTKDIPNNVLAFGNPASIIKTDYKKNTE